MHMLEQFKNLSIGIKVLPTDFYIALWSQPLMQRLVTKVTDKVKYTITETPKIVIILDSPNERDPLISAIYSPK